MYFCIYKEKAPSQETNSFNVLIFITMIEKPTRIAYVVIPKGTFKGQKIYKLSNGKYEFHEIEFEKEQDIKNYMDHISR